MVAQLQRRLQQAELEAGHAVGLARVGLHVGDLDVRREPVDAEALPVLLVVLLQVLGGLVVRDADQVVLVGRSEGRREGEGQVWAAGLEGLMRKRAPCCSLCSGCVWRPARPSTRSGGRCVPEVQCLQ